MAFCHRSTFTQDSFQSMEIKSPITLRKARHLLVFLCHKSASLPLLYIFFWHSWKVWYEHRLSDWPQIIRLSSACLPCSSCMKHNIWTGVQENRKHLNSCHIDIKRFLHHQLLGPQNKGRWGGKLHMCLFICSTCSTYVSCSESFLKLLKQYSACFPKLVPWLALMQACIRNLP